MKYLLMLLLLALPDRQKESYKVIFVRGNVKLQRTNQVLSGGELLYADDKIILSSPKDLVSLCKDDGSRFRLHYPGLEVTDVKKVSEGRTKEFIASVSKDLIPAVETKFMTTKMGPAINLTELENYLPSDQVILLSGPMRIPLNSVNFSQTDQRFFYIRYNYQSKPVNKQLSFELPQRKDPSLYLVIDAHIFEVDHRPINAEDTDSPQLFYYDQIREQSQLVGDLRFRVVSNEDIQKTLSLLYAALKNRYNAQNSTDLLKDELFAEVVQDYGWLTRESFDDIFKKLH